MVARPIVFFDMGNTLLHFHCGKPDAEKGAEGISHLTDYLKQYNAKITPEEVQTGFFHVWLKGISARRTLHVEYPVEDYLNRFLAKYGVQLDLNQCIEAMDRFYTGYRNEVWHEKGLSQTLSELRNRGYRLGVISNSRLYDEVMINCFAKAGLRHCIESFTFSYYLRVAKPRLETFLTAKAKMPGSAKRVIMVGDSLQSDIKPAQELGWTGIWFNRDGKPNDTNIDPCLEIRTLQELLDLL